MNSKLRLLVTEKCPNKCPLCCNKQFNMNDIPVVDRWNYEEVMITGGEPLAFPRKVRKLIRAIRHLNKISGVGCKIYVYTSIANSHEFLDVLEEADGMVLAIHNIREARNFKKTNMLLLQKRWEYKDKSLRLKLFDEWKDFMPENLSLWDVRPTEWIPDCPLPDGEDFRRVSELFVTDSNNSYF